MNTKNAICSAFDLSSSSLNLFDQSCSSSLGTVDLPKNYQNAVECLIQCEHVINTLQERLVSKDYEIANLKAEKVGHRHEHELHLASKKERIARLEKRLVSRGISHVKSIESLKEQIASKDERIEKLEEEKQIDEEERQLTSAKDERIANLEERLVQMSFELASLKAFEDKHRANKRRTSITGKSSSDDVVVQNDTCTDDDNLPPVRSNSCPTPIVAATAPTPNLGSSSTSDRGQNRRRRSSIDLEEFLLRRSLTRDNIGLTSKEVDEKVMHGNANNNNAKDEIMREGWHHLANNGDSHYSRSRSFGEVIW